MIRTRILGAICLPMILAVSACGPAMQPSSGIANKGQGEQTLPPDDNNTGGSKFDEAQFQQIQGQVAQVDKAVDDAEAAFGKYFDEQGNLKIDLGSLLNGAGQNKASGFLVGLIEPSLNKVLDAVKKARTAIDQARTKIADMIAKLNSSLPADNAIIKKLMGYLEKFDQIEAKITQVKAFLADKVDFVASKLDGVLAKLPAMARLVLAGEIDNLKEMLARFKTQLLAL